eukprot:364100-Chlamydomonas_euryale.AAC.41
MFGGPQQPAQQRRLASPSPSPPMRYPPPSQVRLAEEKNSGQLCAVKIMPKKRGDLTPGQTLDKITRETSMLEAAQHCPGVVQLMGCYENDTEVMIVQEVCYGGDLKQYVEESGTVSEEALTLIAFEVMRFLAACHDSGMIFGELIMKTNCIIV